MKIETAIKIAASFFGIGTFIFLGHLWAKDAPIWFILGFIFILIAALVNGIAVIANMIRLIKYDQLETFYSICILLINIPVAAFYLFVVINNNNL